MTVENLRVRLAAAGSPEEMIEGVRDALRRDYTDVEITPVIGVDTLAGIKALISDDEPGSEP